MFLKNLEDGVLTRRGNSFHSLGAMDHMAIFKHLKHTIDVHE